MSKSSSILLSLILMSVIIPSAGAKGETKSTAGSAMAVSSTWTGDTVKRSTADNSARQLAVALPLMPSSLSAKAPFIRSSAPAAKPQVIKFTIPADVGQAIDSCSDNAKKLSSVGMRKAGEISNWMGVFFKQMNRSPVMTPVGGPYSLLGPSPAPHSKFQLWFMRDGRLKTVVSR